jgi:hypothetical protein
MCVNKMLVSEEYMEIVVFGVIAIFLMMAFEYFQRLRAAKAKFSPEVTAQHENLHKALLSLNAYMKDLEGDLSFEVDHWYDLNEAMLGYVTGFYNKQDLDQDSKFKEAVNFLDEFKAALNDLLQSENQLNAVLEITEKLKTNKPMYGIMNFPR